MRWLSTRRFIDPPGGWYERSRDGRLNGRVHEDREDRVWRARAKLAPPALLRAGLQKFSDMALQRGITSVQAMPSNLTARDFSRAVGADRIAAAVCA
jgi:predicted amidohydrolase YtcJ